MLECMLHKVKGFFLILLTNIDPPKQFVKHSRCSETIQWMKNIYKNKHFTRKENDWQVIVFKDL